MKDAIVVAHNEDTAQAMKLASAIGIDFAPVQSRSFPDGETYVRATESARTVIFLQSLHHPDDKLVRLMLTTSVLRDLGAQKIILVAPYLCYMRQDMAFQKGEAISQRVVSAFLSRHVDHIVTIDPHLHRINDLQSVFPGIKATCLSAAPLLGELVDRSASKETVMLIGPDREAYPWTESAANVARVSFGVLSKTRLGDRSVEFEISASLDLNKKTIYLIDDILSSGTTLSTSTGLLMDRGAKSVEALVVHVLCSDDDLKAIYASGVHKVQSVDTVPHQTNAISAVPMIADAVIPELT